MKKIRFLIAGVAAFCAVALYGSRTEALTEEEVSRFFDICTARACDVLKGTIRPAGVGDNFLGNSLSLRSENCGLLFIEPSRSCIEWEKRYAIFKQENARMQRQRLYAVGGDTDEGLWILKETDVSPIALDSVKLESAKLGPYPEVTPWSVRYTINMEGTDGTISQRTFLGNCSAREVRGHSFPTWIPILFFVNGNTVERVNVIDYTASLVTACYIAYDLPLVRQILKQGGFRRGKLPAPPLP